MTSTVINVATTHGAVRVFSTSRGSAKNATDALALFRLIKSKFPEPDYVVTAFNLDTSATETSEGDLELAVQEYNDGI